MPIDGRGMDQKVLKKPHDVTRAEYALWAWTAWTCLFGIYQTWVGIPEIEQTLNDQTQGMISIAPDDLLHMVIAGYALIALISAFFVYKLNQGKQWARSSFLWGFILQGLTTFLPPYHPLVEYLGDVPDLGLQIYAVIMLYSQKSQTWFRHQNSPKSHALPH